MGEVRSGHDQQVYLDGDIEFVLSGHIKRRVHEYPGLRSIMFMFGATSDVCNLQTVDIEFYGVKAERIAKLSYNMFVGHTHSS